MSFDNPMTGSDGQLIISKIRSPNYVAGVSGWVINRDGSAEFNSIDVRGDVVATSFKTDIAPNDRIEITSVDLGQMVFYAQSAADPSLQLRSFLNNGQSQYIGAVEGPDNHPTQGRPFLYIITDDGSVSATNVQSAIGVVGGPQVICDGGGSINILTTPTGPNIGLTSGVSDIVSIVTDSSTTSASIILNSGTQQALMQGSPTGSYVLLDSTAGTAVISNATTFIEIDASQVINLSTAKVNLGSGAGSAAAPLFYLNGDSNSGIYQPAADQIGLSTNGTNRLSVTNTQTLVANQLVLNGGCLAPSFATSAAALQPVHYDNTFVPGTLYRFTSSKRYKLDIVDAPVNRIRMIEKIRPTQFQPYQPTDGRLEGKPRLGFIAEEVNQTGSGWSINDDEGNPSGVDTEQIMAAVVATIQRIIKVLTPAQRRQLWE